MIDYFRDMSLFKSLKQAFQVQKRPFRDTERVLIKRIQCSKDTAPASVRLWNQIFSQTPTQEKCPKHGRQLLLDGAQEIAKELFDHIGSHIGSIVCVRSAMASGKTTMLPVKLVEYFREQRQTVKVVMLMPYVFLLISFLEFFSQPQYARLQVNGFWGETMGGKVDGNRGHKTSGPISGVSVGLLFQRINAGPLKHKLACAR